MPNLLGGFATFYCSLRNRTPTLREWKDGNSVELAFGVVWVNPVKLGYFTQLFLFGAMPSFEGKSFAELALAHEGRA